MKVALLGYSQAGKRTLFTLLSGRKVPDGRKEGECVEGAAPVRDPRVDAIAAIAKPERTRYAETTFVLCPDMVPGSHDRLWLETARHSDLLCLVVRAFSDVSVYHPRESVNAERDRADLAAELLFADLEIVETRLERIGKEKRAGRSALQEIEERALLKCKEAIEKEQSLGTLRLEAPEQAALKSLGILSLKPVIWAFNVDEQDLKDEAGHILTVSCKIEQEIMALDPEERKAYLADLHLSSSGVDRMNRVVYDALGLMSFYTMGEDEVRAWTIRKGTLAPAAAGKIHTDMERGFIRVEIIKFDELMAAGSEHAVKERGKVLLKGKDYIIEDGDICCFRFNV